ncbi:exosome complex exonuclease rrp4 [Phakopsora pachyrhizi]|nr:exosome complex exonuclease rrp4 [Phakopsora pachyrhizi]KAI8446195.1 exosome complex exonuclease rrp4 [Phakopsora pachyrhizi]
MIDDDLEATIVSPGERIASSKHWMRGHGTLLEEINQSSNSRRSEDEDEMMDVYEEDGDGDEESAGVIRSTLAGTVERINRLITVRGLRGRYRPEVGDLLIGRITEVQSKRWKVDAGSRLQAVLMLGSVNLPGGVQRRKLESDELQMRVFLKEGDLLVAEVQAFFGDGSMSLHTRSLKYGKLRNGMLAQVPPQLILRSKSHFHQLPFGVDLIIGINGWIWISQSKLEKSVDDDYVKEGFEAVTDDMYSNTNEPISYSSRNKIARVSGVINLLASNCIPISDSSVLKGYLASLEVSRSLLTKIKKSKEEEDENLDVLNHFVDPDYREFVLATMIAK